MDFVLSLASDLSLLEIDEDRPVVTFVFDGVTASSARSEVVDEEGTQGKVNKKSWLLKSG